MSTTPTEATPQPKRRRIDDAELRVLSPTQITKRSPDLWFDDGNIVLQAETTQFRVHRSHISIHSTFFNDMFLIPQPEGEALVEGCPLIFLSDTAKEWSDLLMAMYNNFKTHPYPDEYPIDRVLSLLRLGHKYQFDYFRSIAATRLKSQMPRNIDEWQSADMQYMHEGVKKDMREPFATMNGCEFDLVNTALEIGMQSVLPIAYLLCVHNRSLDDILDGMKREDGTIVQLSRQTQRVLLAGKEVLASRALKFIVFQPLDSLEAGYADRLVECDDSHVVDHGVCSGRNLESDVLSLSSKPAIALGLPSDEVGTLDLKCEQCTEFIGRFLRLGRERFWNALPLAFGLPPYAELKDL